MDLDLRITKDGNVDIVMETPTEEDQNSYVASTSRAMYDLQTKANEVNSADEVRQAFKEALIRKAPVIHSNGADTIKLADTDSEEVASTSKQGHRPESGDQKKHKQDTDTIKLADTDSEEVASTSKQGHRPESGDQKKHKQDNTPLIQIKRNDSAKIETNSDSEAQCISSLGHKPESEDQSKSSQDKTEAPLVRNKTNDSAKSATNKDSKSNLAQRRNSESGDQHVSKQGTSKKRASRPSKAGPSTKRHKTEDDFYVGKLSNVVRSRDTKHGSKRQRK